MLFLDIFYRGKTRGGAGYKVSVMKLKFYRDSGQQIMDGITGDFLIVCEFKTILTIYGHICIIYGQYNKYSLIYKKYII